MRFTTPIAGLCLAALLGGCAYTDRIGITRAQNYATVTHLSEHINADKDFNEFNPGIGIGSEAPLRRTNYAVGVEAGHYRNSVDRPTTYALAYVERKFSPLRQPETIGLGAFFAYAEYPDEVERAQDRGFVTIGDFVPVVGLQATVPTVGPHEFRFRLSPGPARADAILTLQSNFRF